MKTVCCLCLKTKEPDGWKLYVPTRQETYSHGYCPECYQEVMKRFRASPLHSPGVMNLRE
ncbi:MAG: hypothetical protein KAJ60_07915 [Desulfobulbaceae bacterium]|nr:hypothetical protein [Desulfobulbaceae bacterium]MCK5404979.1 hypothetical protein [Desulfobulbaceae bacterium]